MLLGERQRVVVQDLNGGQERSGSVELEGSGWGTAGNWGMVGVKERGG
ncbi:MAG: hypothetical protein OXI71_09910 [Gemmatimonadota bacterium]|nr:hypothetical protein [Gemmatimonadota bacterium]